MFSLVENESVFAQTKQPLFPLVEVYSVRCNQFKELFDELFFVNRPLEIGVCRILFNREKRLRFCASPHQLTF